MQALLNSGKYKVMEVLHSDPSYDLCLCTDIMINTSDMVIINTYKDRKAINEYLPLYYAMNSDPIKDFRELLTEDGRISAVFRYHPGISFSDHYREKKGSKPDYNESLDIAENLLLNALELDLVDDRIAACAICEENITIDVAGRKIGMNLHIAPFVRPEEGFRGKRLGGMLRKMFPEDRYLPIEIRQFIRELCAGKYPTCTAVYSRWREVIVSSGQTRKEYEKETFMQYLFRRAKEKKQLRDQ